jgi:hypothetical protein
MKTIIILIFMGNQIFAYSNAYERYLREKIILENKKIEYQHQRAMREINRQEEERNRQISEYNKRKVEMANEEYYRKIQRRNKPKENYNRTEYIEEIDYEKKYKNQPQLKLDDLHIYGIKSIKPFKNNKLIIKAENGTFALPKEKFEEAEKINFHSALIELEN